MTKKFKLISILTLFIILFNIIIPVGISYAESMPTIELIFEDPDIKTKELNAGDEFKVKVNFTNPVAGYSVLVGAISYNPDKLELIPAQKNEATKRLVLKAGNLVDKDIGSAYVYDSMEEPGNIVFFFSSGDVSTPLESGEVTTATFKVKSGAIDDFGIKLEKVRYLESEAKDAEVFEGIIGNDTEIEGKIKTVHLDSISLNKTESTLTIGTGDTVTEKLQVTYNPEDAVDDKTVTWKSSDETVATVKVDEEDSSKVVVTALKEGKATITATCSGKEAKCEITVVSLALKSISIPEELSINKGETKNITVTYNPEDTVDSKNITWTSSDETVAKVMEISEGKAAVQAVSAGNATITAKSSVDGVKAATCEVTVSVKLNGITLNKTDFDLNKGKEETLKVTYNPEDATNKTVTWTSSDTSVATVENGKVKAIAVGNATIVALCDGQQAEATVHVKSPLESISIKDKGAKTTIEPLREEKVEIVYNPTDTTDDKNVTWTSTDSSIVTVTPDSESDNKSKAIIKALKPGSADITAKVGDKTVTLTVDVPEVNVTKFEINKIDPKIVVSNEEAIELVMYPDNATSSIISSTWASSDETIATVTPDPTNKLKAVIKGVKGGKATITATILVSHNTASIDALTIADTMETLTATINVSIEVPLESISLSLDGNAISNTTYTMNKGATITPSVVINPVDTTDDTTVTWASKNTEVATVDATGKITAVKAGQAIIEAKVGDKTSSFTVDVKVPMTGISLKSSTDLIKNQKETLVVSFLPADTTDDRTIAWSSSDNSVATVDSNGVVTALKEGTATITAKCGTFQKECTVKVTEVKLTGIAIKNKTEEILKGEEVDLGIIFTPEDTTDSKDVVWTSSDETVIEIDETGKIKALKAGKATITAKSGDYTDSIDITVKEIPITAVEIELENNKLKVGETITLVTSIKPVDTTDGKKLTYVSSDESILKVDENGKVTAVKEGKAFITVVAENGVKSQVEIEVVGETSNVKKDKDEDKKEETTPKTGDKIGIFAGLIIIAIAGLAVIMIRNRKANVKNTGK